jgi:hypothetical protein
MVMSEKLYRWLLAAAAIAAAALVALLLLIWVAGQVAGSLADRWPPVSYPVGAFGELVAILTHPRSAIGAGVPTTGFWLYLVLEVAAIVAGARWRRRRRTTAQAQTWRPATVLQGGATPQPDAFLHAYDQIAARDARP